MPEAAGLIVRSCAAAAPDEAVADEIRALADPATRLLADAAGAPERLPEGDGAARYRAARMGRRRGARGRRLRREGVDEAIRAFLAPRSLCRRRPHDVEPTRALVAVDVNTGGDTSPAAALKADLAAARALPRELRLRGLADRSP